MCIKYARKRSFFVMCRSLQTRNQEWAKPPLEKFSPQQEKCVGRILKLLDIVKKVPSQKALLPPGCPKLVTGLEVQQTFSFPSSLLTHYQIPECFYFNNCGFWAPATVLIMLQKLVMQPMPLALALISLSRRNKDNCFG